MLRLPYVCTIAAPARSCFILGGHKNVLKGHDMGVRSLAYSQEYRFLVSAGFDYDALVCGSGEG